eukprot:TRINITY_DN776025_c0_g1_i1.p1 TRINITY_DN776025_c0_g1~~TRINITY_DN776025_c0_g1_i1.p1  ORF type:complete len:883 (-),score=262.76 TRINITY_DN776025_c0_g1_i1:95-2389(-)
MGCIRVEKITEYLCEPIHRCLKDQDPYVRKTAAICVSKLYEISPKMVEDQGFLATLSEMISDANPTVVANAVAAFSEIAEMSGKDSLFFEITPTVLNKLLAALNECSEWGQVYILDSLTRYTPVDEREAENTIERILPRLQHANAAVVLSAVKIIMKYLTSIHNEETVNSLSRKLAPPLVTLLSSQPEIQYVALRNINLILQKRPDILSHEINVFFCQYDDPIYVKMEKLEIMVRLASDRNIDQVLMEMKEYATEVDVEFMRRAVRAIGRCAIRLEKSAEKCINTLLQLIQTRVQYVVQESIIVIKDIFRRYPNRYESVIATLCENLKSLDEPEARASMIWILGEYADRIDNADELLKSFLTAFPDEPPQVQMQLLTATVKLFLKRPSGTQELVQNVLNMATEESDNPDLRDRGFVYWRLLANDPNAAKKVVLSERPLIKDDTHFLEPALLDQLIDNLGTLASIYHKPVESFVVPRKPGLEIESDDSETETDSEEESGDVDFLGGEVSGSTNTPVDALTASMSDDIFGAEASPIKLLPVVHQDAQVTIRAKFCREEGEAKLKLQFVSSSPLATSQYAIQLNRNTFGVMHATQSIELGSVGAGEVKEFKLPLIVTPKHLDRTRGPSLKVDIAIKDINRGGRVLKFTMDLSFLALCDSSGKLSQQDFTEKWKNLPEDKNVESDITNIICGADEVKAQLEKHNIFTVASRDVAEKTVLFCCLKTMTNMVVLMNISIKPGSSSAHLSVRAAHPAVAPFIESAIKEALC